MANTKDSVVIDPKYAWCRGLTGHVWQHPRQLTINGKGLVELELQCTQCETVRHDAIDSGSGLIESRSYAYAKGYIVPNVGRPKAGMMRRAAIMALVDAGRTKKVA